MTTTFGESIVAYLRRRFSVSVVEAGGKRYAVIFSTIDATDTKENAVACTMRILWGKVCVGYVIRTV